MKSKGAECIRRILRDKARLKRWRKTMLCLSCVVVFITVYALILPAITLERKTVCGLEEHTHTEACYTEGELKCDREEHVHTETCYAKEAASDSQLKEAASPEPEQSKVQETEPSKEQDIRQEQEKDTTDAETKKAAAKDTASATAEALEPEKTDKEAALVSETEETKAERASADGFDLSAEANRNNIDSVKLYYYDDAKKDWVEISGAETEIPGNAKIKLLVKYKDVGLKNLIKNYNYTLTYPLPEILRKAAAEGDIKDGNTTVGTVKVSDGNIRVEFEKNVLDQWDKSGTTSISGEFYVTGEANLSQLDQDGKITFQTAGKFFTLNFGPDAVAQYGAVDITKACTSTKTISRQDGEYISYTITVTAGEDGCPDVTVVDRFTNNTGYVTYADINRTETPLKGEANGQTPYETIAAGKTHGSIYLGENTTDDTPIPPASASDLPGSLVWKIGDMKPNESRTLTYFVKLKDENEPNKTPLNKIGAINNQAVIYAKSYKRGYGDASFTPTIKYTNPLTMTKEVVENSVKREENGAYKITYRLNFTLQDSSTYPLKNFVFWDYLNYTDQFRTDEKALPYISYDPDSVQLYEKRGSATDFSVVTPENYQISWSKDRTNYKADWIWEGAASDGNPACFKLGGKEEHPITVYPGDSFYVQYTLTVQPEALAAMQADSLDVTNRFIVSASNAKTSGSEDILDKVFNKRNVGEYTWDRKAVAQKTETDSTVVMNDARYEYDPVNKEVKTDTSSAAFFTVPAGSYPYTVEVNKTLGDWDATQVSMTDTLDQTQDKVKYTGYMKVEASEYNAASKQYEVKETKWVKIDGLSTFTLKPSALGWTGKNYAYTFTYYAKPVNPAAISTITVDNAFTLDEYVGRGDKKFLVSNIKANAKVQISGDYSMDIHKDAWYYEEPKENAITWKNGKIYWVIEATGTAILKDTAFRDYVIKSAEPDGKDLYLHTDSLVGIYTGSLPEGKTITEYNSLKELLESKTLTDVKDKFTLSWSDEIKGNDSTVLGYREMTMTANEEITLGSAAQKGSLYFIVSAEPKELPQAYRDAYTYKNCIKTSDDGKNWIEQSSATKVLCGGPDILKELGQTFSYDGSTVTSQADGRDEGDPNKIITSALTGAGQYAAWVFKLNYAGELSGTYRVLETVPEGMELSYIRIKWVGSDQKNKNFVSAKEIDSLISKGWEKKQTTAGTDDAGDGQKTTTYYVKGNQALIELGDFYPGKVRDTYSVDVQVVCKVKDPDVLLGGENKTFENQVALQTKDGKDLSNATSKATITAKKLEKTCVEANEKITFTIKANQLGQTMPATSGETLKLIDQLSPTLILDMTSIRAVDAKNNKNVAIKTSFDTNTNTLSVEIPQDKAVTITYVATVNASPGEKVSFSNTAYWEKYPSSGGASVSKEDYSYTAGGTVTGGTNITLRILKTDQYDALKRLQGATFSVVACEKVGDAINETSGSGTWSKATDANGEITFGTGADGDQVMKYNTIYKVTEETAPDGYVKDNEPVYIIVPKKEENGAYSPYVQSCIADSNIHKQYLPTYVLNVTNHKGEITVAKKFHNPEGKETSPVSGTYWFGLYETDTSGNKKLLQKISITYKEGETTPKTAKFVDLALDKTYDIFELTGEDGAPIGPDVSTPAVINGMEYQTSYQTTKADASIVEGSSAVNGDTVTVTNQIRVKELPSTGSFGSLIYRLAGVICIWIAGMLMLRNIKKQRLY